MLDEEEPDGGAPSENGIETLPEKPGLWEEVSIPGFSPLG